MTREGMGIEKGNRKTTIYSRYSRVGENPEMAKARLKSHQKFPLN
jgi:hypothetical protein